MFNGDSGGKGDVGDTDDIYAVIRASMAFKIHAAAAAALCLASFIVLWLSIDHTRTYTWFLYSFILWGALLGVHAIAVMVLENAYQWVYADGVVYAGVNMFLFLIWMDTRCKIPWFVWPALGTVLPMLYHYSVVAHASWFAVHAMAFADINVMLFLTWIIVGMGFPWFAFPLVAWTGVLIVHYIMWPPPSRIALSDAFGIQPSPSLPSHPLTAYQT
ncbi:hypothetical protein Pelo_963 [Pelomyxa schiedti]|nr:hypothetical protein Pelo_963 [Pelomyxa schiedti]